MSRSWVLKAVAAMAILTCSSALYASNCSCQDSCSTDCASGKNGCCGCGTFSNECVCCSPGTCVAGSHLGWGTASCDGGSS